jgi:hypothetical protein
MVFKKRKIKMTDEKEKNIHAIVLVNAIWKASQELPLNEVMDICEETCWNIKEMSNNGELPMQPIIIDGIKITPKYVHDFCRELSDEADAKQIDDAQRYREWKNER